MPAVAVYLVLPARIAVAAACLIFSGVSKSSSPAPKSHTFAPVPRSASAACMAGSVDEGFIRETFRETGKEEIAGCVIIYLILLAAEYSMRLHKQNLARCNFFFHACFDQRGHKPIECASQQEHFLDQPRADVRVSFSRHHEDGFDRWLEAPMH